MGDKIEHFLALISTQVSSMLAKIMFLFDFTLLSTDLRPAFHWNLKQLFVFVVAEYESATNVSILTEFIASGN